MRTITILLIYFPVLLLSVISISKDKFHPHNEALDNQTWPLKLGTAVVGLYSTFWIIKSFWHSIPYLKTIRYNLFNVYLFASSWNIIVLVLVYFFLRLIYKKSFLKVFCFKHSDFKFILKLCLALTIVNVFTIFFWNFEFILGMKKTLMELLKSMDGRTFVLYYLNAVTIGPFLEETLFRGLLYVPLMKKTGRPIALIITSIIWTEQHMHVLPGIGIFITGLVLAWLYDRRGSLLDPLIFHIFMNIWLLIYYVTGVGT